jgi:hypothetical protein
MVVFPIDKYLAQDYRNTLRTSDAPQNIETDNPVLPVIDIQKGLPQPNSKQRLRYKFVNWTTTNTDYQIATPSSIKNIYYLGMYYVNTAATASTGAVWDGSTGSTPSSSANTSYDELMLDYSRLGATDGAFQYKMLPFPTKCSFGIRANFGVAAGSGFAIIWYIEELV